MRKRKGKTLVQLRVSGAESPIPGIRHNNDPVIDNPHPTPGFEHITRGFSTNRYRYGETPIGSRDVRARGQFGWAKWGILGLWSDLIWPEEGITRRTTVPAPTGVTNYPGRNAGFSSFGV
jgi:hypothetical protein